MADQRQQPFRVACPDCEVDHETRTYDDSAAFVAKHREHTGHLMEWERAEFGLGLGPNPAWALTCETCSETWTFEGEGEALAFKQEHTEYTDHEIDDDPTREGSTVAEDATVVDIIDDLSEHFDDGVPEPLVIAHSDGDAATVRREIQKLKRQGTVFEPSPFRLEAV
jgi:ribosomal protein S27E